MFLLLSIVPSHFIQVLKTSSWEPNSSIVGIALYWKWQATAILRIFVTLSLQEVIIISFTSWQYFSTKTY